MLAAAIMINETATPASTKRSALVAPANLDTPNTIKVVPRAPKKARNGTVRSPKNSPVCNKAKIAPNAPPEDIPKRCGSASGLRVTA